MDSKSSDDQTVPHDILAGHAVSYRDILLAAIDSDDQTFCITTRADKKDLLHSIQQVGLIQPPLLIAKSGGHRIVCGFRRIAACRQSGRNRITAGILGKTVDRFTAARISIADNAFQRSLNLLETSRALKLLDDFGPDELQRRNAAEILGLPTGQSVCRNIKRICRLPLSVQEGILMNTIELSMALELGELDPKDAEALLWLFGQLKVGLNKQRELLLLLKEIAGREDTSIPRVLAAKALQEILKNAEMDRAAKRQKVRSYLRQRRFPSITQAESDYHKWVKHLKLGSHIDLIPPKDFEGNTFRMTLRFQNRQELSDLRNRLGNIMLNPALGKILD
jgi:ParB-like chromosome segregation protein Spo0J